MRLIFMGTSSFACPLLSELIAHGHEILGVFTRAPQPSGRGLTLTPSPVAQVAQRFHLPIFTPKHLREATQAPPFTTQPLRPNKEPSATSEEQGNLGTSEAAFEKNPCDAIIVASYGLLLPKDVLEFPHYGCLNLHGSLLPRWRGAAPIQRALMAGDQETGVTIMQMDEGLDTGPIALTERMPIGHQLQAGLLQEHLARLGADLMIRALAALERGTLSFQPQPLEGATYAHKIQNSERRIDWNWSAEKIYNHIRALAPLPGAHCEGRFGDKTERIKLLCAELISDLPLDLKDSSPLPGTICDERLTLACGTGFIRLNVLQRAGKTPLGAEEFLRGHSLGPGSQLL